jgi:hypothetical protein
VFGAIMVYESASYCEPDGEMFQAILMLIGQLRAPPAPA